METRTRVPAADAGWVTRDVVRIIATQVVFGFGWSLYLLIPKYLATELAAGPDVIGRINAMGGIAGLITVPFAARGLDRIDRRRFFQVGAALIVIVSIGFMQVREISPLLYLLQGGISAAFVLAFNATAALLTDYAPPTRLGQAIGWLGGANVGMNAVAAMIVEPLAESHGWDAVFMLGGIAGLVAFALSFGLRSAPAERRAPADSTEASRERRVPSVVPLLITTALAGAVFIAMFGFVQPYAVSLGAREVRLFFIGYTLAVLGGRVFLGGLGDRMGRRGVSAAMLGGYAVAALTMRELRIDALALYGVVFGAAHGILYPTLNALLLEILPASRRGLGMVLYNGAFNLGTSAGSFTWGMIAKHAGYPALYAVAAAHALLAVVVLHAQRRS